MTRSYPVHLAPYDLDLDLLSDYFFCDSSCDYVNHDCYQALKPTLIEVSTPAVEPGPIALALAPVLKIQFGCRPWHSVDCSRRGSSIRRSSDSFSF